MTRMKTANNNTSTNPLHLQTNGDSSARPGSRDGNAYLYILIVMSFYGVFLCGIMLGYIHCKRREKKKPNVFTHLIYEEEKREWGAVQKKHSQAIPSGAVGLRSDQMSLLFGETLYKGRGPVPLSCALFSVEQSSVSSLCSSADMHFAIEEEESESGTAKGAEAAPRGYPDNCVDSADVLKERG